MLAASDAPLVLEDGRQVWLRPLDRRDGYALMALRRRLSDETVRRRFLRYSPPCAVRDAFKLADVDQQQRVAIAAVPAPNAIEPILAVARFHVNVGDRAELALLVEDAYQHVGLGRQLLAALFSVAHGRALRSLYGYTLYGNDPALRLLRGSGHALRIGWHGGDVLEVELDV